MLYRLEKKSNSLIKFIKKCLWDAYVSQIEHDDHIVDIFKHEFDIIGVGGCGEMIVAFTNFLVIGPQIQTWRQGLSAVVSSTHRHSRHTLREMEANKRSHHADSLIFISKRFSD